MLDFLLNIGSGGLLGVAGSIGKGVMSMLEKKQSNAHAEAIAKVNAEANIKIATIEAEKGVALADARKGAIQAQAQVEDKKALQEAVKAEANITMTGIKALDFIRGINRPALTWALLTMSGLLFFSGYATPEIRASISDGVLFLTSMAVAYWFGDRPLKK